jgi:hypothetical protein
MSSEGSASIGEHAQHLELTSTLRTLRASVRIATIAIECASSAVVLGFWSVSNGLTRQ